MESFFTANKQTFLNYLDRLENLALNGGEDDARVAVLLPFIKHIAHRTEAYDECVRAAEKYGTDLLEALIEKDLSLNIRWVLICCGRIAVEKSLRRNGAATIGVDDVIFNWFTPTNSTLTSQEWHEMQFLWPGIQRDVITDQLLSEKARTFQVIVDCKNENERFVALQSTVAETISKAETRLDAYQASAERIETAFNFAGLHEAFRGMAAEKRKEVKEARDRARNRAIWSLLPFLVPIAIALMSFGEIKPDTKLAEFLKVIGERVVFGALVILPLVGVLLYFFRLAHTEHRSLSAVLLQLEHRQSICTFIQNYAEFTGDKTKLEKFEALIFGGITPDPGAVPSTFDGIEQFAKVLEAVKK